MIVGTLALVVAWALAEGRHALTATLPWVAVVLLWFGFLYEGQAWLGAWMMKRNNRHLVAGQEHVLSDAGYGVRCGEAQSTIQWAGFERLVETRDFFLAFPQRNAAYYLPKRCLTAEQTRDVRELFREHGGDSVSGLEV